MHAHYSLGLDFVDDTVRAVLVDIRSGHIAASCEFENRSARPQTTSLILEQVVRSAGIAVDHVIGLGRCADVSQDRVAVTGLPAHIAVAPTVPRAHACVPGAGVASPSTMVLSFTKRSCCLLMNSRIRATPSAAVVLNDGILPGYVGYQFDPIEVTTGSPEEREGFAVGVGRRCESLRSAQVPVRRFVATGEIAHRDAELMQLLANVLDGRIKLAASNHPEALGAAIFGALAAGGSRTGHASVSQAVHAMAQQRRDLVYRPDIRARKRYHPG